MNNYEYVKQHHEQNLTRIRAAAEQEINQPIPFLTEEKFALYEKNGNRLIYENDYFARRRALVLYGLASLLDRNRNYLLRLEDIIHSVCEEETWALPAHVKRGTDSNWRRTVDLFASETAQALAEITSLLKDDLSEETRAIARENVIFRVLDPFNSKKAPYSWWEKGANNWNAVCCGCLGSAALYLDYGAPTNSVNSSPFIKRILESLKYYIASFPEDGACLEGVAYFSYGMGYYTVFARQLKDATDSAIDPFKDEKLAKIAAYQSHAYFSGGGAVPFADGDPNERFRLGLSCYLSSLYPEAPLPPIESAAYWDTDFNYRWATAYRDVHWTTEWLQKNISNTIRPFPTQTDYKQYILPISQQVLIHDERNSVSIGIKGGHNDEPHNHNDVGSFFLMKNGEVLLEDLGFGEYTKDYFAPAKRYEYFVTRALGHNIPLLNGQEQRAGKTYRCTSFIAEACHVVMEIGAAYGEDLQLRREFNYNKETGELTLTDSSPVTITEIFITRIKPEISDEGIAIIGNNAKCVITIFPSQSKPQIIAESYQDHYGVRQTAYRIIHGCSTCQAITIKTSKGASNQ